jgi:class 3 adenylate cyclase/tetratricopeptide (TPR) repeat protein
VSEPRSGLVAVLFTDLVGSTELMSQLGDRAFDDLRRAHFAALGRAVAAHGGEEVKNTGDGLMAVFPSAAEAVEAAVAMQQATARQAKKGPLSIRVGVAVGDATLEGGDYFGTPVVEAARLVAAARPGQILTTQIVRALAGRADATFDDLGSLDLKGLTAPVPACRVRWEPATDPALPMPPLLTDVGRIFVGRESELDRLGQLWKETAAGERRVALLAGEPGVGKTRLAAELALQVHDAGGLVLAGRCDEDLGVPYQPFVEALRHFVDHTRPGDLHGRLGRYGGELARLVPEVADAAPDFPASLRSDPETERYRLFDAVAGWLAAAGEEPLLFVLDDLQWAAKPTLLLLRHLLRSPNVMRVLFLGTYRDTDVHQDHPLRQVLADLRRQGGIDRLSLLGLDSSSVVAFMEQAAGHQLDEDDILLARAVYEETEGNPFFVREILRHLTESGGLQRRDGRWATPRPVGELGIPESVRDVVGRRLSRLSADANQTLRFAAVTGPEFELSVVQAACGLEENVLLSAVEEATEARLTVETVPAHRYRFAHALVRDTLYEDLSAARRVALHRRVAEAIEAVHAEALDDYLPALAHHWSRASTPAADTTRAIDYATRAGHRALSQLANDEAATYYRQALDLLDAGGDAAAGEARLELLICLGEAQRRAGDPASRQNLLGAVALANALGNADALARAAMANTRGVYWSAGTGKVDAECVAALEAALAAIGNAPSGVRARLLATLGLELVFAPDRGRRVRLSDESLRIARTLHDPATLAHVLMTRTWTINAPDTLADRLASVAELLTLSEKLDDPLVKFRAHFLRARITLETGEFDDGKEHLEKAQAIAEELGQPTLRFMAGWLTVGHVFRTGRIDDADRAAEAAFEIGESIGQPDAFNVLLLQRSSIRLEQGRLGELITELADLNRQLPGMPGLAVLLAAAHCDLNQPEDARHALEPVAAKLFGLPQDPLWLGFLAVAAEVACHLRHPAWGRALYDLLRPYPAHFPVLIAVTRGCTAHYLGMLAAMMGRYDEAEEHFLAAKGLVTRLGVPVALAHAHLEWARMLFARDQPGDADRGRQLLTQALGSARELRLANVERQAGILLGELP